MDLRRQQDLDEMMLKYTLAKRKLETDLSILLDEHTFKAGYNPVEHIKSRIKSLDSAKGKLQGKNLEFSIYNIERYVYDMIGIRIVCSFLADVYEVASIIRSANEFVIKKEIDYIKSPKSSGYRSYHMHVLVPIHLESRIEYIEAEIQIRTVAMDCWASLDHKLRYKMPYKISGRIEKELLGCADEMMFLDTKMQKISDMVSRVS